MALYQRTEQAERKMQSQERHLHALSVSTCGQTSVLCMQDKQAITSLTTKGGWGAVAGSELLKQCWKKWKRQRDLIFQRLNHQQ